MCRLQINTTKGGTVFSSKFVVLGTTIENSSLDLFYLGFTPCKAEPLRGVELQEKEPQKI